MALYHQELVSGTKWFKGWKSLSSFSRHEKIHLYSQRIHNSEVSVRGLYVVVFFSHESMITGYRHFNTNMTQTKLTVRRLQVNVTGQLPG